jgi:tetratricopeptide (TPR) repeat protein
MTIPFSRRFTSAIILLFTFAALPAVAAAGNTTPSPPSRGSAAKLFVEGNELYAEAKRIASEGRDNDAKAKFAEAEVVYENLLATGFSNWQVHYNLGNALYQQGALGKAIASYRRAERLAPGREEIQFNLEKVKAEARDREAPSGPPGWVRTLLFPYYRLSLNEIMFVGLAVYAVFSLLLMLVVFVRRAWAKALCTIALAATVTMGATLAAKIVYEQRTGRGVVISDVCAARFGHGAEYEKRFEVHDGAEFVVLDRYKDVQARQEWLKVRLFIALRQAKPATDAEAEAPQSRAEGWIEAKDVELL